MNSFGRAQFSKILQAVLEKRVADQPFAKVVERAMEAKVY